LIKAAIRKCLNYQLFTEEQSVSQQHAKSQKEVVRSQWQKFAADEPLSDYPKYKLSELRSKKRNNVFARIGILFKFKLC